MTTTKGNYIVYGKDGERKAAFALEQDRTLFTAASDLLENLQYIDCAIGGDSGEEYCDDEVLEIHVTGRAIKDIKQAITKATS